MIRRWEVVSLGVPDGREVGRSQFMFRRTARRYAAWQNATAAGNLSFLTPLPPGMAPLWTSEVRRINRVSELG